MDEIENSQDSSPGETVVEVAAIALEAVPYVGGILSSTANFFLEKSKNERLNKFLIRLAEDLQAVKEQINTSFIRSDEFRDLTEDIISKAAETRQQEKLDALRAIFLNVVLSDHPNYDEAEEIANLISNWQPRHVILLKILLEPQTIDEQMGKVVGSGGGFSTSINQILAKLLPKWDEDQIDRTWKDLYDRGIHRTPGTRTMITDQGIMQLEGRLTDYGLKIAKYLKNPAHEMFT